MSIDLETLAQNLPIVMYDRFNPQLRQCDDGWHISFPFIAYNGDDISFEVVINHHLGNELYNRIKVLAWDTGDSKPVVDKAMFEQRVKDILDHEDDVTEEQARAHVSEHTFLMVHDSFWMKVRDCVNRWNAMLFLFSPAIACR